MRLIDADTIVTIQVYDDMTEEWDVKRMTIAEAIDKWSDEGCPPTIEAEPVRHGRWEWVDAPVFGNPYGSYKCDCGNYVPHKTNYCPHCGAKMDMDEVK